MSRYTGPKARVNRATGAVVYEQQGAMKAAQRRPQAPGMHARRGKVSDYGLALVEKRKVKHYYGMNEAQLRRLLALAASQSGDTGQNFLLLCERRLENVVRRAGFTATRPQARQGIAHGHFTVNGHKVDKPSYLVSVGDVVALRDRPNLRAHYQGLVAEVGAEPLAWLDMDAENLTARVLSLPAREDVSLPVEVRRLVEAQR